MTYPITPTLGNTLRNQKDKVQRVSVLLYHLHMAHSMGAKTPALSSRLHLAAHLCPLINWQQQVKCVTELCELL
jgi:hypothetical protein